MAWYGWVLVALFVFNASAAIHSIDQPRKPLTRGGAIFIVLADALIVWALLSLGHA